MPTTDTELCNQALILLGETPLTSLSDDLSDPAKICRNAYPTLRDGVLSSYPWRFGLKRAELSRDATTPYAAGRWRYSFLLPPDRLSGGAFAAFRTGDFHSPPFAAWSIIGDRLVTDSDRIWIEYPVQIGEADFPPYFVAFLVDALCARIAFAITDQQNTADAWQKKAHGADPDATGGSELQAQLSDAQQFPAQTFQGEDVFDLIAARF